MNTKIVLPMRPRRLRRTLALVGAGGMLVAGITTAEIAKADTATLAGSFGFEPTWSAVTTCPCQPIRFNYAPTQRGIADGVKQFTATINRVGATPAVDSAAGYSLGTHALIGWVRDNPLDERTHTMPLTLVGAPEAPHNPRKGNGHRNTEGLPQTGDYDNVTFVVREYDPVSDAATNPNFWSRINSRMSTHIDGYDDLDAPDVVWTDEKTGSTTEFHKSDTLPMLRWRAGFTSEKRMAELDARYRPRIDKAYDRPWEESSDSESPDRQDRSASNATTSDGTRADRATTDRAPTTSAGSSRLTRKDSTTTTATTDADADTNGDGAEGGGE